MAHRDAESVRDESGGIISLANAVDQHRKAIEYDLLTRTGYELDDVGDALSWAALESFLSHVEPDSALMKELNPEMAAWTSATKTNAILADIFDILAAINANLMAVGTRKPARKPKPYPRPGGKDNADKRHFGKGALPPDELRKWMEEKRAEYARDSTSDHNGHTSP